MSLLVTLGIATILRYACPMLLLICGFDETAHNSLSSIFLIFSHGWAYMFNNDPNVVSLVASVLPLVALFQVFDGLSATTGGILRARGRQVRYPNPMLM